MAYETLLYDVQDGVGTITLNRPDSYNALSTKTLEELKHVFRQVERDKAVRAVVLTGAGKGFSTGADLTENGLGTGGIAVGDLLRNGLNVIVTQIRSLEKPVLCAINGVAAGASVSLALACDLRIASEKASFVLAAFVNIGIIPDAGGTWLLPQFVGVGKAMELTLFADGKNRLSAADALVLGLVNRVVAPESFAEETRALALRLAQMPTKAIGLTKRAMYRAAERSLAETLEYEAELQTVAFQTKDFVEGVTAFLEKRPPVFTGE
ncbi:MAG: enoyl-CoA hydratase/isomerase family protein [Anaerolineaceae bacterium]|nr:enoyl-CoA hydratase/isomerase family protein [Anaerolineaceae bacterium]